LSASAVVRDVVLLFIFLSYHFLFIHFPQITRVRLLQLQPEIVEMRFVPAAPLLLALEAAGRVTCWSVPPLETQWVLTWKAFPDPAQLPRRLHWMEIDLRLCSMECVSFFGRNAAGDQVPTAQLLIGTNSGRVIRHEFPLLLKAVNAFPETAEKGLHEATHEGNLPYLTVQRKSLWYGLNDQERKRQQAVLQHPIGRKCKGFYSLMGKGNGGVDGVTQQSISLATIFTAYASGGEGAAVVAISCPREMEMTLPLSTSTTPHGGEPGRVDLSLNALTPQWEFPCVRQHAPRAILTASANGDVRMWTWAGEPLGQMGPLSPAASTAISPFPEKGLSEHESNTDGQQVVSNVLLGPPPANPLPRERQPKKKSMFFEDIGHSAEFPPDSTAKHLYPLGEVGWVYTISNPPAQGQGPAHPVADLCQWIWSHVQRSRHPEVVNSEPAAMSLQPVLTGSASVAQTEEMAVPSLMSEGGHSCTSPPSKSKSSKLKRRQSDFRRMQAITQSFDEKRQARAQTPIRTGTSDVLSSSAHAPLLSRDGAVRFATTYHPLVSNSKSDTLEAALSDASVSQRAQYQRQMASLRSLGAPGEQSVSTFGHASATLLDDTPSIAEAQPEKYWNKLLDGGTGASQFHDSDKQVHKQNQLFSSVPFFFVFLLVLFVVVVGGGASIIYYPHEIALLVANAS
jgi:hypothetical protein